MAAVTDLSTIACPRCGRLQLRLDAMRRAVVCDARFVQVRTVGFGDEGKIGLEAQLGHGSEAQTQEQIMEPCGWEMQL